MVRGERVGIRKARQRFAGTIFTPAAVRQFVRGVLERWGVPDSSRDDAVLLASELASNASEHAPGGFTVGLRRAGTSMRIEVFDRGFVLPNIRRSAVDSEGGRGLMLVDRLASAWGTNPAAGGKVVWFELLLP
jgi:anti-sigma regulatory factor (Ser/Thr protein kinase)